MMIYFTGRRVSAEHVNHFDVIQRSTPVFSFHVKVSHSLIALEGTRRAVICVVRHFTLTFSARLVYMRTRMQQEKIADQERVT